MNSEKPDLVEGKDRTATQILIDRKVAERSTERRLRHLFQRHLSDVCQRVLKERNK